jgi:hypothetical protein
MNTFDLDPDEEYQEYLYNMQQAEDDETRHKADESAKAEADNLAAIEMQEQAFEYEQDCIAQQRDLEEECGNLPF